MEGDAVILINDSEATKEFIERSDLIFNPKYDQCIVRMRGDEILGGVTYDSYYVASISMHVAAFTKNWLNRDFLWVVFHYPFVQLGVATIFLKIQLSNRESLEFALDLGFKIVVEIDDVFPDGGCAVLSMKKAECRWLDIKPRQVRSNMES